MVLEPGSLVKAPSVKAANDDDHIYDIVKVTPGSGNYGLIGMSGFSNPINLVEDTLSGNLYVIEYNWNDNPSLVTQITLLKVNETPAAAAGHRPRHGPSCSGPCRRRAGTGSTGRTPGRGSPRYRPC